MDPAELLRHMQNRVSETAIGASALRNQGAAGVIAAARGYLKRLHLAPFAVETEAAFRRALDTTTEALAACLPDGARHWGIARKAVNLFLREALYNHYLRSHYRLQRSEGFLEVPLDRYVAQRLAAEPEGRDLIRWTSIKALSVAGSDAYQEAARAVAKRMGSEAVHLDLLYWRGAR